jgi:hypothetical protein
MMSGRGAGGAAQGEEGLADIGGEPIGAHHFQAAYRQLDGERNALYLFADAGHGGGGCRVQNEAFDGGGGAVNEQLDGAVGQGAFRSDHVGAGGESQAWHAIEAFAGDRQAFARRDEDRDGGAGPQDRLGEARRRCHEVFAIVENQQRFFLVEIGHGAFHRWAVAVDGHA